MSDLGFASIFMIFFWGGALALHFAEDYLPYWLIVIMSICLGALFMAVLTIKLERNRRVW